MVMSFRTVRDSILALLEGEAAGRFRVIGYQKQSKSAENVKNDNRAVEVYYSAGEFPRSTSSMNGPFEHNCSFKIDFTVASPAKGDLTASTPAEYITSLANVSESALVADRSMDELFDHIFQILMDAENIDLGLPDAGDVGIADRWITNFEKDDPISRGEYFVITASALLTLATDEETGGETPTAASEFYTDTEANLPDSDQADDAKAGTFVDNT